MHINRPSISSRGIKRPSTSSCTDVAGAARAAPWTADKVLKARNQLSISRSDKVPPVTQERASGGVRGKGSHYTRTGLRHAQEAGSHGAASCRDREIFLDNLLVRIRFIIVMIRWTGFAPWEVEIPFPGSLTCTFLGRFSWWCRTRTW